MEQPAKRGSAVERQKTGRHGEDAACRYLADRGHVILARNWRSGHEELDIVTLAPDGLHFVEVKTRAATAPAPPQDSVDRRKQQHVVSAARRWLRAKEHAKFAGHEIFFDIVAVTMEGEGTGIDYFPDAFIPIYA